MKHRKKNETMSFRIDISVKELLQKYADKYDLSLGEIVSQIVENYARMLQDEEKTKKL